MFGIKLFTTTTTTSKPTKTVVSKPSATVSKPKATSKGDLRSALNKAIDKVKTYRAANKKLVAENKALKADNAQWEAYADYWKQRALIAERRAMRLQGKYESVKLEFTPAFDPMPVINGQLSLGTVDSGWIVPNGKGHKSVDPVVVPIASGIGDTDLIIEDVIKASSPMSEDQKNKATKLISGWIAKGKDRAFMVATLTSIHGKGKL